MRRQIVDCKTRRAALRACPWACDAIKVCGGYLCFESAADADRARRQR